MHKHQDSATLLGKKREILAQFSENAFAARAKGPQFVQDIEKCAQEFHFYYAEFIQNNEDCLVDEELENMAYFSYCWDTLHDKAYTHPVLCHYLRDYTDDVLNILPSSPSMKEMHASVRALFKMHIW